MNAEEALKIHIAINKMQWAMFSLYSLLAKLGIKGAKDLQVYQMEKFVDKIIEKRHGC